MIRRFASGPLWDACDLSHVVVIAAPSGSWWNISTSFGLIVRIGACLMSNAVQIETEATAYPAGSQGETAVPETVYKVLAPKGGASSEDLYGFRAAMTVPAPVQNQEAAEKEATGKRAADLLPILLILVFGVVGVLVFNQLTKTKAPPQYVDLGTRRFDSAGLGARLIARWEGSTGYQLYIDPLDPQQTAGFQAVTMNQPHPVSVVIRLLDNTGAVACQKEIVLPNPAAAGSGDGSSANDSGALLPMQTSSGDTVQNIAGPDGQLAEITVTGGLPCSLKQYQSLASWQFFTNFPTLDEQAEWVNHQRLEDVAKNRRAHGGDGGFGFSLHALHLPAAIDDDDVIVGDNPAQGTLDTEEGRIFWIGVTGMRNRSAAWQVFPAPVHFHCDRNGNCMLTRVNSRTSLQARLVK